MLSQPRSGFAGLSCSVCSLFGRPKLRTEPISSLAAYREPCWDYTGDLHKISRAIQTIWILVVHKFGPHSLFSRSSTIAVTIKCKSHTKKNQGLNGHWNSPKCDLKRARSTLWTVWSRWPPKAVHTERLAWIQHYGPGEWSPFKGAHTLMQNRRLDQKRSAKN